MKPAIRALVFITCLPIVVLGFAWEAASLAFDAGREAFDEVCR